MPGTHQADVVDTRSPVRANNSQSVPSTMLAVDGEKIEIVSLDSPTGLPTVVTPETPLGIVTADGLPHKWFDVATFLAEMGDDLFQQMVGRYTVAEIQSTQCLQ